MDLVTDNTLPANAPSCFQCEVRSLCNGSCPKDRFVVSRDGDPGQNYLCPGLELFFTHTRPAMQTMARLLQRGLPPSDVMAMTAAEDAKRRRNQPCPCGSGERFRSCHGNNAPCSPFTGLKTATDLPPDGSTTPMQADPLPQARASPVSEASM